MILLDDLRARPEVYKKACIDKKNYVDIDRILVLDEERKKLIVQVETVRAERNTLAASMKGGKPDAAAIERSKKLKEEVQHAEELLEPIEIEFMTLLKLVPNLPSSDTPIGTSEDDNVEVYTWGEIPSFSFPVKNHWELAQQHDLIDKDRASKVAGSRFAYLKGPLVTLQFALMQYVMQTLSNTEVIKTICADFNVQTSTKPFTPVLPPYMIRTEVFDAMDRLEPSDDRYKIEGEDLWLQGSAEHVLGSMYMNETLAAEDLPIRMIGYASSFRKEAGTYGKDMEGIIRMHQFDKLEMEIIATPEQGLNEHLLTVAIQEYLVRSLELPYRKLLKCTADIGKPNVRGVDIEVWLPGQNKYRETHTADYMTDYQSRRMKTKVQLANGETAFVHTIDATAFALGRIMVAIIENYQQVDGSVQVPTVLQPFLGGKTML